MKPLRFLTWNLNGAAGDRARRLVELLAAEVTGSPAIAALQAVKPAMSRASDTSPRSRSKRARITRWWP